MNSTSTISTTPTAEHLRDLSDDKLVELADRIDKLCWTMSSPAYSRRGTWAEELSDLCDNELNRRGIEL